MSSSSKQSVGYVIEVSIMFPSSQFFVSAVSTTSYARDVMYSRHVAWEGWSVCVCVTSLSSRASVPWFGIRKKIMAKCRCVVCNFFVFGVLFDTKRRVITTHWLILRQKPHRYILKLPWSICPVCPKWVWGKMGAHEFIHGLPEQEKETFVCWATLRATGLVLAGFRWWTPSRLQLRDLINLGLTRGYSSMVHDVVLLETAAGRGIESCRCASDILSLGVENEGVCVRRGRGT